MQTTTNASRDEWYLTADEVYPRQAISSFRLAPDGQHFCFVLQRDLRAEEVSQGGRRRIVETPLSDLCLLPSNGGYPRPLTHTGDVKHGAVWSPDGQWLLIERSGPSGETCLQTTPLLGGPVRTIYRGPVYHPRLDRGDAHLGCPRWSPDGSRIAFAADDEGTCTVRLISVDGDVQRELFSPEGYIDSLDWSPDGRQLLVVSSNVDGRSGAVRLLDVDARCGDTAAVLQEENRFYRKPVAAWVPGGAEFLLRSNRSGWSKLWLVTRAGEIRPFTEGDWDDYAFRVSPAGQHVVYASRADQPGNGDDLWIAPLSGGEARRLTRHPGVNVPLAWSNDDRIFYWHTSPVEPGDLWVCGANGGESRRLTWSAPLAMERKLRPPEEIVVRSEDGTPIPTLVYLPVYHREGQEYPAIVWIRGGPTGMSRSEFAPFYNWLANLGFVVLTPNYRGSIGHGVEHMDGVAAEGLGKNDLQDVLAVGGHARTLPQVDVRRGVGVGGWSWGGYLSLMAATQAPDFFSCAIAGSAISDWSIQQADTMVRYFDHWLVGGWVYDHPERVRDRSPVTFAERIEVPLLVYHGEADRDVPFSQVEPFVEKARRGGVAVECVTYPGEGHSNKLPRNQQDLLDRIGRFFRRHLQPWDFQENPTGKQVQY